MPSTTTNYGWSYGVLTDGPVDLLDISELATAADAQVAGTTVIGVPGTASVSMTDNAWTTLCSVSITLPTAQPVEIVAWARILNTGASRPICALQVLDGSTHLFGTGQIDFAGTGDNVRRRHGTQHTAAPRRPHLWRAHAEPPSL